MIMDIVNIYNNLVEQKELLSQQVLYHALEENEPLTLSESKFTSLIFCDGYLEDAINELEFILEIRRNE